MDQLGVVIVPTPAAGTFSEIEETVALSGTRKKMGRVFEKHILTFGDLIHPVTKMKIKIDKQFADKLVKNFNDGVCPIVQVPLANDSNDHVESPKANLGEVLGLRVDEKKGKIYAQLDARKDADEFGKTYLGASAFMHLNYPDTRTGERAGPTLLHVAVTNRPYVTDLDPYEELVAASAGLEAEDLGEPALLELSAPGDGQQGDDKKETAVPRTLEEILAELKADHEIDVEALKTELETANTTAAEAELKAAEHEVNLEAAAEKLAEAEGNAQVAEKVLAALSAAGIVSEDDVKLSSGDGGSEIDADTLVAAVGELAQQNVKLSNTLESTNSRIAALEKSKVEVEVDALVGEGRILPAKRDTYLNLALTNRDMFDELVPDEPIVKLSQEEGISPKPEEQKKQELDVNAELARLTAPDGPMAEYLRT